MEILAKKNYNISKACKAMGIDRTTYYLWIKEEWFEQAIADMEEADLDDSEETLRLLRKGVPKRDKDGNIIGWHIKPEPAATFFHLKTKGKKRGYIERQEFDYTGERKKTADIFPDELDELDDSSE